jgi:drug/metabolite transporter (DMT)-like permease
VIELFLHAATLKKAYLQLHLAVWLAGFTGVLGRLIELNEGWLVWYRVGLTALAFWVWRLFLPKSTPLHWKQILPIMAVGVVATLHWLTFYASIKYANVSIALVCFSSIGFFTALFEPLILKTRFRWVEVGLGLLTLLGIYLVFYFDVEYKTGMILGMISALLGSLFPIWNRFFLQQVSAKTLLSWQQTGGFIFLSCLLPFYLPYSDRGTTIPSWADWGWILVLVGGCSVWAFQLSAAALKKLSAFTVNLSYNLEPIYGIALAFLLFQEDHFLHTGFFYGAGLILLALFLHAWPLLRKRNP